MSVLERGCVVPVQQEGSPLNLLTTLSSWAQNAQTALFQLAAPVDPTTGQATTDLQVSSTPTRKLPL
jgi:hypothetical protein